MALLVTGRAGFSGRRMREWSPLIFLTFVPIDGSIGTHFIKVVVCAFVHSFGEKFRQSKSVCAIVFPPFTELQRIG